MSASAEKEANLKRVRIETAGPYVDVVIYPISASRQDDQPRGSAENPTGDFRQRVNDRKAAQKFKRLIACNFSPGDKVATLTYRDDTLPSTADEARTRRIRPFMGKLRKACRELCNGPLRYFYVTEGRHGDHRLHHHMIVANDPVLLDQIEHLGNMVSSVWSRLCPEATTTGRGTSPRSRGKQAVSALEIGHGLLALDSKSQRL